MNRAIILGSVMALAVAIMLIWTRVDGMSDAERARTVGMAMAVWLCCGSPLLAFAGGWAAHSFVQNRRSPTGKEL